MSLQDEIVRLDTEIANNQALLADPQLAPLAQEEIANLQLQKQALEQALNPLAPNTFDTSDTPDALDTLFLIWVRLIKRKLPFKKSNDHLALRFLALGFSKAKALLAMLLCSLSFALSGVITSQASNFWGVIIILLVIPSTILLSKRMGRILVHG